MINIRFLNKVFQDYINVAKNCYNGVIKYEDCYKQGFKFTLDAIASKYQKFFNDVLNIYDGNGWYQVD